MTTALKEIHIANSKNRDANVRFVSLIKENDPKLAYKGKTIKNSRLLISSDETSEDSLIKKHQFGNNSSHFEKSFQFKQHDHLICNNCGKINEFCDPRIKNILDGIEKTTNFHVKNHSLYIYGECNDKNCKS